MKEFFIKNAYGVIIKPDSEFMRRMGTVDLVNRKNTELQTMERLEAQLPDAAPSVAARMERRIEWLDMHTQAMQAELDERLIPLEQFMTGTSRKRAGARR